MDQRTLANLILRKARENVFNNKGRILIDELNKELKDMDEKPLTAQEIIEAFKTVYTYEIEHRTKNVILIDFRKRCKRNDRCLRKA